MTLDVKKVTVQMLSNCQYRKTGPKTRKLLSGTLNHVVNQLYGVAEEKLLV
jgi:hypothetical protein